MHDTPLLCDRAENGDRFIAGIIVPWDQEVVLKGRAESFAPGSMTLAEGTPVVFRYGHKLDPDASPIPIGEVVRAVDTEEGLWIEARLLDSQTARDAYAAVDAGLVRGLSAEYSIPGRSTSDPHAGQGRVTRAVLNGAVLTERPAFKAAQVLAVRARKPARPRFDEWSTWFASRDTVG